MRYLLLAVLCTILFAGLAGAAPTVFLKDGTSDAGSSVWMENDKIYVSTRSEIHEYNRDEVQLDQTMKFNQIGAYQAIATPGDHTVTLPPPRKARRVRTATAAPADAAAEKAAATAPAKPTPAQPAAPPVAASPAPPKPAPLPVAAAPAAPTPAAKVATPPAPADPSTAPDKAELDKRRQEVAAMMAEAVTKKDPELMKKALEMQKDVAALQKASKQAGGLQQPGGGFPMALILLVLVVSILIVVANWIIFERAGQAGWKCLIPIYNMYILMVVAGKPWWWFLLLFVPLVGAAIYLLAMLSLAKRFGRSELFGVGIFLLPMIFLPLLAFSDSQYQG